MAEKSKKLTPMMERYLEVKDQNPGTMLLFRMGDFYELFYDDAQIAARILGLTLTSRDKNSANPVPMAGFPYHALENYLQKLIESGCRVAICDQVEDPKTAKGLVRREVTRIVTPGTLTDEGMLDPRESNFLASIAVGKQSIGYSWLELSTGRFIAADVELSSLNDELARIRPAECLISESSEIKQMLEQFATHSPMMISERPAWSFAHDECHRLLLEHFGLQSLSGFDLDDDSPSITAAGALLEYVRETQKSSLAHITRLEPYHRGSTMTVDESTRHSLELTRTMRDGKRDGTLLAVMDQTVTPMGARLLADWLSNPLTNIEQINARLDAVDEFVSETMLTTGVREQLEQTYDMQRLTARVATGRANPRDLAFLSRTLGLLPKLKAQLAGRKSHRLQQLETQLDLCAEVRADIEQILVDEPPLVTNEGGLVRPGFNSELDELRELASGGKEWIAAYQAEESERTGISNLKIGFNRVFGYYLEVTAAQINKVPDTYVRKQTLKNQERYITPELKEYEDKVLRAEEKSHSLEADLFQQLRERVAQHIARLQQSADVISHTDVLSSLAHLAVKNGYCRPEIADEPILDIREGRHPVLDRLQPSGQFVPNDIQLETANSRVQIITGPNMAGKSTYIRQVALITIMAQVGSYVPASEARIGIADRVFARVGASDELSKGQSTFMVEMTETARILNAATSRSLVILDEIGRGTSTYDGISLAWAVTEYLHDVLMCRTLFATHYHELTGLTQTLSAASNWNVAVSEENDSITFLHKIIEGAADKSYGIHVARLAGVPFDVIDRAKVILDTLEDDHVDDAGKPKVPLRETRRKHERQLSLFGTQDHPLLKEIRDLDLDQMTPLAALEQLHKMRVELGSEK